MGRSDLLVWGETEEQHDASFETRTSLLYLKLNEAKCQIKQQEACCIDHILTKEGLKPGPKKTEAIRKMETPKTKEELQ